jgi:hypothetical protein
VAAARSWWRARGCSVSDEVWGGEDQHAAIEARVGPKKGLGGVGRRRELAEVRARGGGGNGGSAGSGAHTREEMGVSFYSRACMDGVA